MIDMSGVNKTRNILISEVGSLERALSELQGAVAALKGTHPALDLTADRVQRRGAKVISFCCNLVDQIDNLDNQLEDETNILLPQIRELLISLGDYTGNIDKRTGIDRCAVVAAITNSKGPGPGKEEQ